MTGLSKKYFFEKCSVQDYQVSLNYLVIKSKILKTHNGLTLTTQGKDNSFDSRTVMVSKLFSHLLLNVNVRNKNISSKIEYI